MMKVKYDPKKGYVVEETPNGGDTLGSQIAQLIGGLILFSLVVWVYVGYQNSMNADRAERDRQIREAKEIILEAEAEAHRNRPRY